MLHCTRADCQREYPILDGIPLLIPDLRGFVASQFPALAAREDLAPATESLLGDCCGPGSAFDLARQHLSLYGWDHYADLDPEEPLGEPGPGSARRVLQAALDLADSMPTGPVLDLGCSVGRTTFALAEAFAGPVLGVDLNFAMLRLAARVLREGVVRYPRRRVGLVYDRREFPVGFAHADRVDFWACDALALPLPPRCAALAVGLNVLDCVSSPRDFLAGVADVLAPGGWTVLTTPYDWSTSATPVEAWLGGHSQRGGGGGASEPVLRALLTPGAHPQSITGLQLVAEAAALPWQVRLHERSSVAYRVHAVAAQRTE
jgi:SAM-dependent methyltransferase